MLPPLLVGRRECLLGRRIRHLGAEVPFLKKLQFSLERVEALAVEIGDEHSCDAIKL